MKEGWEIKKLGEVCDIINGFAFKSHLFREEGEGILRISNIQNGYVDTADIAHFSKDDYPKVNFEKYAVLPNDIVVALSGATTGKFGINKTENKLYLNQRVAICRESISELNHIFLLYYLQTQAKSFLESAAGVAQPNLSTEQMKQYSICIPPLAEQEKIVEELDCLSGIIEKKKQQLKEYDALAQSIFYEMFGNPIDNEKGWDIFTLSKNVKVKGRVGWKGYKKEDLRDSGPLAIGGGHLTDSGGIDLSSPVFLSMEKYLESPEIMIEVGDIILVQRGTIGKVGLIANDIGMATINPCVLILRPENLNSVYLLHYFLNSSIQAHLKALIKGVAQPMITQQQVNGLLLPIPPLYLQQEFASKIDAIEKQKELIKQSIAETETLFNSRMDYYFN